MKVDERVNDRKTGCEGRTVHEFHDALGNDIFSHRVDGGESFQDEKQRLQLFFADLKRLTLSFVLVVTHCEPMKIIKGFMLGLTDEQMWHLEIDNCEVIKLCYEHL
jgi:broad specificity phosphatase PhoE